MNRSIKTPKEFPLESVSSNGKFRNNRRPKRSQRVVETIDGLKKCTIASFGWLALVIAIVVALIIELGAVKRVWAEMFPTPSHRVEGPHVSGPE